MEASEAKHAGPPDLAVAVLFPPDKPPSLGHCVPDVARRVEAAHVKHALPRKNWDGKDGTKGLGQ